MELLKDRCVKSVIDPMAVPLERRAERTDLARKLRRLPILSVQRIALLLEDLVDILVLATNLFEKLSELRHTRLRGLSESSGNSDWSVIGLAGQSGKPPQSVSVRQLVNSRDTQTLFIGAKRRTKDELRRSHV